MTLSLSRLAVSNRLTFIVFLYITHALKRRRALGGLNFIEITTFYDPKRRVHWNAGTVNIIATDKVEELERHRYFAAIVKKFSFFTIVEILRFHKTNDIEIITITKRALKKFINALNKN